MSLEDYAGLALQRYFEVLNTKPSEGEYDRLLDFYNDRSKFTYGKRKLGGKDIVEELRKENKEFHLGSYSLGSVDEDHVVILGECLVGNNNISFTIVLEHSENEKDKERKNDNTIFITNQIMN